MIFDDIVNYIEQAFKIKVESKVDSNILYMRVIGLDDVSLSRYIKEKYEVKITTKKIEGYKLYNNDWIKIENVDTKIPT